MTDAESPSVAARHPGPLTPAWRIAIGAAAAFAFALKLRLALTTYGTNDVYRYEEFAAAARLFGASVYRETWDFNHPASMIHGLRALAWVAERTRLPFAFWIRVPALFADLGCLVLLGRILEARLHERSIRWALLLFALAPPLLLISGFHGNTDTVMIFFLLLSIHLEERGANIALAGAAFGLSMCIKLVPIVAAPAIFFYLPSMRRRIAFFAAAGAALLICWSPYLFQEPRSILGQVFGYRSYYGHWGFSFLLSKLALRLPAFAPLDQAFQRAGAPLLLASVGAVSWAMNRGSGPPRLYQQLGIVFFLFLSCSSGFGVQYLAWPAAWVVGLGALPAAIYFCCAGTFLFLVYNQWAQGLPWYIADSNRVGDYDGHLDGFQIACWLSVLMLLAVAVSQLRARPASAEPRSAPRLALAVAAAAMTLLLALGLVQAARDTAPISWPERLHQAAAARAAQYGELAFQLYQEHRYQDAIAEWSRAGEIDPRADAPPTDLAIAYAALNDWDRSIESSRRALALQPSSQLAKNNLRWALEEKGKRLVESAASNYQAGRFDACIADAQAAVQLEASLPLAYNDIAACQASQQHWDEAIAAATEAIKLAPEFQLAKNNLAWARQQKAGAEKKP